MSYTYARRKNTGDAAKAARPAAGPSVSELAAGAQPTQEQMGHRVDLPDAIREKMESSFGADFSNVKLYESETVAQAGAEAMTQGANIAFAPGQLDLASTAGQALLGHELSHVVSQSRGESAGQGFLNDSYLEAQADRQGMMAAQGESVYSGPVTPVGAGSAVSAAGPMQAKKAHKKSIERNPELYNSVANATAQREEAQYGNFNLTDQLRVEATPDEEGTSAFSMFPTNYDERFGEEGFQDVVRAARGRKLYDKEGNERQNPLKAYDQVMGEGLSGPRELYQGRLNRGLSHETFIDLTGEDSIIDIDDLDNLDPDMFELA